MVKNKKKRTLIGVLTVLVLIAAFVGGTLIAQRLAGNVSRELSVEETQQIVDSTLAALPKSVATGAVYVAENTKVTVNSVSYGSEKDVILDCTYETKDVLSTVQNGISSYIADAYELYVKNEETGVKTNATKVKLLVAEAFEQDLDASETLSGQIELRIYEVKKGEFSLYLSEETVNTLFGGLLDAKKIIESTDKVTYNGEEISIANKNTLRTGIKDCIALNNYDSKKPDTAIGVIKAWNSFKYDFNRSFIANCQWKYLSNGLLATLGLTL